MNLEMTIGSGCPAGARRRGRLWVRMSRLLMVAAVAMLSSAGVAFAARGAVTLPASGVATAAETPPAALPSLIGRWVPSAQDNVTATAIAYDFSLQPGGKIDGYIEPTPSAAQCLQESGGPNDQNILTGTGPTYTGVGVWSSGCSRIGFGPLVIVVDTSVTPNTFATCSNQPGGPPPVFGSCQAGVTAVRSSSQPFPGTTGVVFGGGRSLGFSAGGSSTSLNVPVQCGSSYYQGTTPCDATYYVWHCGSSYSASFTACPPNTPGALPPVSSSSRGQEARSLAARRSSTAAVAVGGGTVTLAPKAKKTLKFGLTSEAKSAVRALRNKLAALAKQARKASAKGETAEAKRLRAELSRHSRVTLLVRVTNNTNGVSKTSKLTVKIPS